MRRRRTQRAKHARSRAEARGHVRARVLRRNSWITSEKMQVSYRTMLLAGIASRTGHGILISLYSHHRFESASSSHTRILYLTNDVIYVGATVKSNEVIL